MKDAPSPNDPCTRCGALRRDHYAVNYADGPMVSGEVLVCPRAVFTREEPLRQPPEPEPE